MEPPKRLDGLRKVRELYKEPLPPAKQMDPPAFLREGVVVRMMYLAEKESKKDQYHGLVYEAVVTCVKQTEGVSFLWEDNTRMWNKAIHDVLDNHKCEPMREPSKTWRVKKQGGLYFAVRKGKCFKKL